jgi:hypothetical protein
VRCGKSPLNAAKLVYLRSTGGPWLGEGQFMVELCKTVVRVEKSFFSTAKAGWIARGVGEPREGQCVDACAWEEYEVLVHFPGRVRFEDFVARLALPVQYWAVRVDGVAPSGWTWYRWVLPQLDSWQEACSALKGLLVADVSSGARVLRGRGKTVFLTPSRGADRSYVFDESDIQRMLLKEWALEEVSACRTQRLLQKCRRGTR